MKIIDLSTSFDSDWSVPQPPPTDAYHKINFAYTKPRDGFYLSVFTLTTHSGTHIDAPMHRFARHDKTGKYFLEDGPL